ncbi:MAG: LicD family protein [Clostridia bacterium]|nr:LicD family protein [Clostridia bacterium]
MNQLQRKQFDLLTCFAGICDTLEIPWFLVCGSALGAVKYGGFIPWDDDVDMGMMRPDYDRFLREAPALLPAGLFLQTFRSDPAYPNLFAKLRDSRTTFAETAVAHLPMNHGVFIDIFPLDGYPTDQREGRRLERKKTHYKRLLLSAFEGDYSLKARMAIRIMRLFGVHKRTAGILDKYEKLISAYDIHTSPLICNHGNWQGKLEYAPREQYGEGRMATFEGLAVRVPADAEGYLTRKYGDFRSDPPLSERIGHHICTVVDLDTPFAERLNPEVRKTVKCLVHYDLPDSDEERVCHLPAYTKTNYLFHCFKRLGFETYVLSASQTRGKRSVGKRFVQLDGTTVLELLPSRGRGGRVRNGINRAVFGFRLFARLMRLVKRGDTLWVYHSLGLMSVLRWLKRFKRFRLVLELEELYGDVRQSKWITRREIRFAHLADAYIFPTQALNERVNRRGREKPFAITHGTYQTAPPPAVEAPYDDDGRIHVVYAGTLDPRKGGVYAAMNAARYLPASYHVHILGAGTPDNLERMKQQMEEIRSACACTLTYDGILRDQAYTDFLHRCHIGLSTQDPAGDFNATSFPSKILAYMACGLRVVSARIPAVEHSGVGECLYYYGEQTPQAIAEAIKAVNLSDAYHGKRVINRLDREFLRELKELLQGTSSGQKDPRLK